METKKVEFDQLINRGCGLDVHKETVVATVKGEGIQEETRTYETFTSSLKDLKRWLRYKKVTHVAMESTGVYWKPVFKGTSKNSFSVAYYLNPKACKQLKISHPRDGVNDDFQFLEVPIN